MAKGSIPGVTPTATLAQLAQIPSIPPTIPAIATPITNEERLLEFLGAQARNITLLLRASEAQTKAIKQLQIDVKASPTPATTLQIPVTSPPAPVLTVAGTKRQAKSARKSATVAAQAVNPTAKVGNASTAVCSCGGSAYYELTKRGEPWINKHQGAGHAVTMCRAVWPGPRKS